MATIIHDEWLEERLIAERSASGADRYDEVWEGVYVMAPMPNDQHQMLVNSLAAIFQDAVGWSGHGHVRPGVNVSDRVENWKHNYRVPDVAVFLSGTSARNHDAFWFGGPDFAVEIVSPNDQSRQKLDFYAKVGTRELLIVDRDPRQIELYRLRSERLELIRACSPDDGHVIASEVLAFEFELKAGGDRPRIDVRHPETGKSWTI